MCTFVEPFTGHYLSEISRSEFRETDKLCSRLSYYEACLTHMYGYYGVDFSDNMFYPLQI